MSRIALVTGGIEGIGAATSEALAAAGFRPVATYAHNDAAAEAFGARTGIPVRKWDVGSLEACQAGVAAVEADFGPIDVLVNNAGVTADATLHKMTAEQWHRVLSTNLTGCFNMCRSVIEGMRARNFGRIVNVSSINGQSGQFGQTNYAASKAGIIGFSKSLALESASRGITVNVVAPGYVDTAMVAHVPAPILAKIVEGIPVGRLGRPAEIAHAIVFLAGEMAGYITGSTLTINGGRYLT
ncbi:MAG: acetoacetyl-CoA reductase [Proteobacteria bacterium]|nr:acetoacetyl-CoA reductase [Pseudomonadota bacterium]